MFCEPWPLRRRDKSSWKVTSSVQCSLFSIPRWPRPASAAHGRGACAGGNVVARVEAAAILEFCLGMDLDDGAGVSEAEFSGKPAVAIDPVDLAHD